MKPSGKELDTKKSRYTDVQIAFALKQAETGTPVAEAARLQAADGYNPPSHGVYNADQPPKALGAKMNMG